MLCFRFKTKIGFKLVGYNNRNNKQVLIRGEITYGRYEIR